ncbi:related to RTA1 domain protein [Fusarium mangiferae]|uniref:Related to RTA1 domain protein n=1 Tax=Fusarium mangiferae TaxID=192010 RepID=A0A1L7UHL7_FUSMA|nr:uncharacterized protein FMAN_14418 [Fusarium mangiferae]CVL07535.1 related to RTA1 domain protein [Fusarium mangiferae]
MSSTAHCTELGPTCPVEATTYGYAPVLGANATLLTVFILCAIIQLVFGTWKRVYSYSFAIFFGCVLEAVGYVGRLMMHQNPWSSSGFRMQIICLIIAPSFIAAGIYLTMKHFIRCNNPEYSFLKPQLYTWIFIGCDIGSILLQAAGGGIAGSAGSENQHLLDIGNNVMIAGIAFQVVTMVICGILASIYAARRWQHRHKPAVGKFYQTTQVFMCAVGFAYLVVLIRCIYRLPEMAGGWGNELMRNEMEFLVLDGLMVALASVALTIVHPAFFLPAMRTTRSEEKAYGLSSFVNSTGAIST